jgi:hypothetical protein
MKRVAISTLLFIACLGAASAQDQKDSGQTPPKEEVKCVTSETSFKKKGNDIVLQVELTNVCEKRHRCTINAYTTSAYGARQGEKTVTLAAKSKGDKAKGALEIKVRSSNGGTMSAFNCKGI